MSKVIFNSLNNYKTKKIGFIGLGKIGLAMSNNFFLAGYSLTCHDVSKAAMNNALKKYNPILAEDVETLVKRSDIIVTVLPNDEVLKQVTLTILPVLKKEQIHVSCSTVSPNLSRELAELHNNCGNYYIAAPVFARPDGMENGQSTIPISGNQLAIEKVLPLLKTTSTEIYNFGSDPGAANIVKLCGNYLIGCAIQSISESLQLAESNGVNRNEIMKMFSSTIFDCLIYKGYGDRVANRDHFPYENAHFNLQLGKKDISLVLETAFESGVTLPFGVILYNRFINSITKGRDNYDWSAIALLQSEDSGFKFKF